MPLSEDEQRILNEIEENLSATDPKLVQQVSDTTLYRHAARVIKWSVVGFIAGLLLMIFTFTTTLILGILGFVVMLGCALAIEHNVRKLGRAGFESLDQLHAQRRAEEHARQCREPLARALGSRRPAVLNRDGQPAPAPERR